MGKGTQRLSRPAARPAARPGRLRLSFGEMVRCGDEAFGQFLRDHPSMTRDEARKQWEAAGS